MSKKLERVLKLGSMQEFLEMSDEDLKKARTSGPLMAGMINKLWRAVCQLADERNKEATEADFFRELVRRTVTDSKDILKGLEDGPE